MFTPYSQLTADEQAVLRLTGILNRIPQKQRSVMRVLMNAVAHLEGRKIHPDNQGECARLWKRLGRA